MIFAFTIGSLYFLYPINRETVYSNVLASLWPNNGTQSYNTSNLSWASLWANGTQTRCFPHWYGSALPLLIEQLLPEERPHPKGQRPMRASPIWSFPHFPELTLATIPHFHDKQRMQAVSCVPIVHNNWPLHCWRHQNYRPIFTHFCPIFFS